MGHGAYMVFGPLCNSWVMDGNTIAQHMGHGKCRPRVLCATHDTWVSISLYNPCAMGWVCHCTIHGAWVIILLHNPWAMEYAHLRYSCAMHGPWYGYTIVQSMGHGEDIPLYNPWAMGHTWYLGHCATHGSWVGTPLHNAWAMGSINSRCSVQPMTHG
jgi:hypothetical protein